MEYKVSLIVPCYLRPQRTLRAIQCVLNQDMNGWEALFIGDGCPFIQELIESNKCLDFVNSASQKGNKISFYNQNPNMGGWGYKSRNFGISIAKGEYIMFMDNDDMIEPFHFSHYYDSIKDTDNDFMYFDVWLDPIENRGGKRGRLREAKLSFGDIGHPEIIAKTKVLKSIPPQSESWGHDWELIKNMIDSGCKYEKGQGYSAIIMSVGELRELNID